MIETREPVGGSPSSPGPHLAKIISHADPEYMGRLEVQILREVGNNDSASTELRYAYYSSPFFGQTSVDFVGKEPDDYDNTQKAYGMWMVPPDIGTLVIIIAIDGDPKKTYIIGCVPDNFMNFSVPGHAATKFVVDDSKSTDKERIPVAEYNKIANPSTADPTSISKPASPLEKVFDEQGLLEDDTRGITTSSARRETPSSVFGISTPGPVDKQGKRGKVGKAESKIVGAFVSRLPGSTFVMDDGDDKFLRRTTASEGPPDYAAVEQDETDGLPNYPHNELVRIRTRTGHQILLHNSEDLIYIGNARGTAWIELTSDGKIDVYAEDSISIRSKNDFNFYADRDVNIEAGRNINIKANNNLNAEAVSNYNVVVGGNGKVTLAGKYDLNSGGTNKFTSGGDCNITAANTAIDGGNINLNSGVATAAESAEALSTFDNPDENEATITSIMLRVPTHEPWPHHENLDPASFKPDATDREAGSAISAPEYWKKYSTITDTFAKIKAGGEDQQTEE